MAAQMKMPKRLRMTASLRITENSTEDEIDVPLASFIAGCPSNVMYGLGLQNQDELTAFIMGIYGESIRCVPYETVGGNPVLLPKGFVHSLCGTTGLCTGNTREEALFNGLLDIDEHYVTRKIFQFRFTAPSVPVAVLAWTDAVRRLRNLGYSFSVLDCSLGKSFPVLGLALFRSDGKRAFAVGAGVSPEQALERCLEVMLTGGGPALDQRFHDPNALNVNDGRQLKQAYDASCESADGPWPDNVFGGKPVYPFGGFSGWQFDDAANALAYFLDSAAQYGGTLFVRQYSLHGDALYELYMPGASETDLGFTMNHTEFQQKEKLRMQQNHSSAL